MEFDQTRDKRNSPCAINQEPVRRNINIDNEHTEQSPYFIYLE